MDKSSLRAAVVQAPPVFLNLEASLARAEQLAAAAVADGAELVVFPETWLPGYPVWVDYAPGAALWDNSPVKALHRVLSDNAVPIPGTASSRLQALAKNLGAYLVMGVHERDGNTLYNSMLSLDPAGDLAVHRKLTPTYTERLLWGRGDGSTLGTLDSPWGPLGGLICWEHWMPLARAAMHARRETIHVAQWSAVRELHQIASRHYAFEGQCFVIAAGCYLTRGDVLEGCDSLGEAGAAFRDLFAGIEGDPDRVLLPGGSAIIDPRAAYSAGPLFDSPDTVVGEIDLSLITEGSLVMDTDGHYSRPDVFRLQVNEARQENVSFGQTQSEPRRK